MFNENKDETSPDMPTQAYHDEATTAVAAPPVIDTALRFANEMTAAAAYLEHHFVFRKLGLAYDYISPKGQFPSPTLPTMRDVREKIPNAAGLGTGMGDSLRTTCLLFDAYATRLELGIGRPEEDRIIDRLVGGLIRFGTTAPDNRLICGLAPDGRTFYPVVTAAAHTWYAHGLFRACSSPVIAPESQVKLKDIAGKWMAALEDNNFSFAAFADEMGTFLYETADQSMEAWLAGIRLLHLAGAVFAITADTRWEKLFALMQDQEGPHLGGQIDLATLDSETALNLMVILADLNTWSLPEIMGQHVTRLRRELAVKLTSRVVCVDLPPVPEDEHPDFTWRDILPGGGTTEAEVRTRIASTWPRLAIEEKLNAAAAAAAGVMLCGDAETAEQALATCEKLFTTVAWTSLQCAAPLPALLLAHALGQEFGFWDPLIEKEEPLELIGAQFGTEFDETFNTLLKQIEQDATPVPEEKAPEEQANRRRTSNAENDRKRPTRQRRGSSSNNGRSRNNNQSTRSPETQTQQPSAPAATSTKAPAETTPANAQDAGEQKQDGNTRSGTRSRSRGRGTRRRTRRRPKKAE